jgi:hypothetical protein
MTDGKKLYKKLTIYCVGLEDFRVVDLAVPDRRRHPA